jgi:branched-subunit amino acid transport protein
MKHPALTAWLVAILGIVVTECVIALILGILGIGEGGLSTGWTLLLVVAGAVAAMPWIIVQAVLWDRWER